MNMSFEEIRAWILGTVAVLGYAVYLALTLRQVGDAPLTELPYTSTLLWTVVSAIVAGIVLTITAGIVSGQGTDKKDQRDREISRFGDHVGSSFVVIGAVSALAMSLAEWDYFWIANVIYLAFVLSSILGSTAKIVSYRWGFHPW